MPDSTLKDFEQHISSRTEEIKHLIAANEGNAVAYAIGHFLGKSKPGFVYFQNSGLGNALNPLISLAHKKIYSIPMLIMIGWRAAPNTSDEPQHIKQGSITPKILEDLDIPWVELNSSKDIKKTLSKIIEVMNRRRTPVALLVKQGFFSESPNEKIHHSTLGIDREQALKAIIEIVPKATPIISTTGYISRELLKLRVISGGNEGDDFLCIGGMGHASSIAAGLSLAIKRQTICIDGDGALIMHMGAISTIARLKSVNLMHIVLNNGVHESVGSQPTGAEKIPLHKIAKNLGYKEVAQVDKLDTLKKKLKVFSTLNESSFLEIRISPSFSSLLPRPVNPPILNRNIFMKSINK